MWTKQILFTFKCEQIVFLFTSRCVQFVFCSHPCSHLNVNMALKPCSHLDVNSVPKSTKNNPSTKSLQNRVFVISENVKMPANIVLCRFKKPANTYKPSITKSVYSSAISRFYQLRDIYFFRKMDRKRGVNIGYDGRFRFQKRPDIAIIATSNPYGIKLVKEKKTGNLLLDCV